MRKPEFASKKSVSHTTYWKHPRKIGKRMANKSERQGAKKKLRGGIRLLKKSY